MKIIDRYILKKILSTFFFVVIILMAIIIVIDVTEKMDKYARNKLDFISIVGYYLDFVPWVAGLITPITVFIAIIYVTSRMASHTEIIAILSSGVSFRRMLVPYLIASVFIGSISFGLNGWIIPKATKSRLAFELQYFNNRSFVDARNIHLQIAPGVYLFIQNYNNLSNIGYQFTLERFSGTELVEKLSADNIQWDSTKQKWILRYWRVKKVHSIFADTLTAARVKLPASTEPGIRKSIDQPFVPLESSGDQMDTVLAITPKDFEAQERSYDGMTIPELNEQIAKLKFRGATGSQVYEVEKQTRFASPFTTFVLVFMGVTVSSRKSRGGTGLQIALGFVLAFIFILFFMLSRTFAEAGEIHPVVAAWIPNVVFSVISGFMYYFTQR